MLLDTHHPLSTGYFFDQYTALGQFTAALTVSFGAKVYTTTGTITVDNPVSAQFSATPLTGVRPLTVTFTDQSNTTYGTLNAWQWDFGDGATSTQQNPTHVYSIAGSFSVKLIASTGTYSDTEAKSGYVTIPVPNRVVIAYTYDGLNRLTKATSTGAVSNTFDYAYDAIGNRTAQTATITSTQVTNYAYDAANRLSSMNGQAYTWDDNGNLVNDGEKTYSYDQANRLTNISTTGLTWSASYNGDGARLRQVSNGTVTTYTLDLAAPLVQVLVAKDNAGETRYVYGITRIGEQQTGGWVYHLTDALGSVRQLADSTARIVLARGYTPYGEPLWMQGTASSRYAFTGEDYDPSVGLVFLRARYMQPRLGVFTSRDPWSGDAMRPGSMNGWNYVDGNPISLSDPTGLFSKATIAHSFGYEDWSQLLNSIRQRDYDNRYGLIGALLHAQKGDTMFFGSAGMKIPDLSWSSMYVLGCDQGIITLNGTKITESYAYLPSGISLDDALLWRQTSSMQLHYYLLNAVDLYVDDTGGTDLPDFRGGSISGNLSSVGPALGGLIGAKLGRPEWGVAIGRLIGLALKDTGASGVVDRFGNVYVVGFTGYSNSLNPFPISGQYFEGYVARDVTDAHRIPSEQDIQNTITGYCGDAGANITPLGGAMGFCPNGNVFSIYSLTGLSAASASIHVSFGARVQDLLQMFAGSTTSPLVSGPFSDLIEQVVAASKPYTAWDRLITMPKWSKSTLLGIEWLTQLGVPSRINNECDECQ